MEFTFIRTCRTRGLAGVKMVDRRRGGEKKRERVPRMNQTAEHGKTRQRKRTTPEEGNDRKKHQESSTTKASG